MISTSPYGEKFKYSVDVESERGRINAFLGDRQTVVVQGLGFVGMAMVAALARPRDTGGNPIFNVIGIDLPDEKNYWKIGRVNSGKPAALSSDKSMDAAYKIGRKKRNILATYSDYAYTKADVVVVDVNLDVKKDAPGNSGSYRFSYGPFEKAVRTVARNVREDALVIIETTVPPGTTEKLVYPIFAVEFKRRGFDVDKLHLAYSYERVMPGPNYLDSITNFYRVYSGVDKKSALRAKKFFESFINTKDYPLHELRSTTSVEMAKVLENSFRVINIAFMQEWTAFAHRAGVDLFEVINAIRARPTHRNIMFPGFGVGGYCLPKDSLLADWSYSKLFSANSRLRMTLDAVAVNDLMPDYTLKMLKQKIGRLKGKHITILGVSYRGDVADTRHSPTGLFYDRCRREGAKVNLHDPLVTFWREKNVRINNDINHLRARRHDAAIFAVRHKPYLALTAGEILSTLKGVKVVIDANNIINDSAAAKLAVSGVIVLGVGKGHWDKLKKGR